MGLVLCAALLLTLGGGDIYSISEDDYDFSMPFEYRLVFKNLGDIPVGYNEYLGQNFYIEQRLIFASNLYCGNLSVTTEFDVGGIIDGDLTSEYVNPSRIARNHKYGWAIDRLNMREIYLQYAYGRYKFVLGQKLSYWGLGMLINDGRRTAIFGEHYSGDSSAGLFISIPPLLFLPDSDFSERMVVNIEAGYVLRDNFGNNYYGDIGYLFSSSVLYDSESGMDLRDGFKIGLLYARRVQSNRYNEQLRLNVFDLFIKREHFLSGDITLPNIFFNLEGALISGVQVNRLRGKNFDVDIFSFGLIIRAGVATKEYMFFLDVGLASGDSNAFDRRSSKFVFNPDFKEGLILFSELYAFSSAASEIRAHRLLIDNEHISYFEDISTDGGISNTVFASANFSYSFAKLLTIYFTTIIAGSFEPIIDIYYTTIAGKERNFYNAESSSSLLGIETDIGFDREWYRNKYFIVRSRINYGHLFAGGAVEPFNGTDVLFLKFSIDNL